MRSRSYSLILLIYLKNGTSHKNLIPINVKPIFNIISCIYFWLIPSFVYLHLILYKRFIALSLMRVCQSWPSCSDWRLMTQMSIWMVRSDMSWVTWRARRCMRTSWLWPRRGIWCSGGGWRITRAKIRTCGRYRCARPIRVWAWLRASRVWRWSMWGWRTWMTISLRWPWVSFTCRVWSSRGCWSGSIWIVICLMAVSRLCIWLGISRGILSLVIVFLIVREKYYNFDMLDWNLVGFQFIGMLIGVPFFFIRWIELWCIWK